jgi:predicted nucleic acid-binding protein
MSGSLAYLDSSAYVKLVLPEPESGALVHWLRRWPEQVSASLLRVEVSHAVRLHGPEAVARARRLWTRMTFVGLTEPLLDTAASIPLQVRSLDAIHLAAALSLGDDLAGLVTYDQRLGSAARAYGIVVHSPD